MEYAGFTPRLEKELKPPMEKGPESAGGSASDTTHFGLRDASGVLLPL